VIYSLNIFPFGVKTFFDSDDPFGIYAQEQVNVDGNEAILE